MARKAGLLSLEQQEIENQFLQEGMQLLIDGHNPDVVKTMLNKDRALAMERHETGQKIFIAIEAMAPAMGMIGTLIGLVQMLAPKSIGPAMAVALLTTLYGAMIGRQQAVVAPPLPDLHSDSTCSWYCGQVHAV